MSKNLKIGWIGLGKMGLPMASNLAKAGYELSVYNRSPEKSQALADRGVSVADGPGQTAANRDVVFTMVSDDKALEEMALGSGHVFDSMTKGSVFADMSTVSPVTSERIAAIAEDRGIQYLRAPVNGTVMQAEAGSLVILVSGPKNSFDACDSLFECLGDKIFYIGDGDQARYLKLCINMMVGITSSMMGEALAFGEAGGLDWDQMIDIIANSAVGAPVIHYKMATLKNRDFTPAFSASQMAKDFDLMIDTARARNMPIPITSLVRQHWSAMIGTGRGEQDFFAYVELLEELAGLKKK